MAKKLRVFHVARELNISNEAVINYLSEMDKSITSQMSAVSEEQYEAICSEFKQEAPVEGEQDFRQQLRERQLLEEFRRNKARMELEERLRYATQLAEERPERLKKAAEEEEKKAKEEAEVARAKSRKKKEEEPADEATSRKADDEVSVVDLISKAKREIDREGRAAADSQKARKEIEDLEQAKKEEKKKAEERAKKKAEEEADARKEAKAEPQDAEAKKKKDEQPTDADKKSAKEKKAPAEGKETRKSKKKDEQQQPAKGDKDKEKGKRKGKKRRKRKISEEEIQESIRQTLASMEESRPKRRRRKAKDTELETEDTDENDVIRVSEYISTAELAEQLEVEPGDVIKTCMQLGMLVSINQRLDSDSIIAVADEYGYDVELIQDAGAELLDEYEATVDEENTTPRSPVVTIMGHVDHGKTSLLDRIRKSNVIAGEAGGITQHIGAYEVRLPNHDSKSITFLDTPGHEAFTAMRARGAQATDLVVLIVAADDGVQPQTVEAINHALAASVPIVVAINKIDKASANVDRILQQLGDNNILVESWGGKYQSVEISAKTGQGVDKLLEMILLEAEILELMADPKRNARGVVIEARLDKGKGALATILVQNGTLRVGDMFIAGQFSGKVRAMYDERMKRVKAAPPSAPVQVVGFDGVPQAGDLFVVMDSERDVRDISTKRQQLKREQDFRRRRHISLDQIGKQIREGQVKELNIILKADVDGSLEALSDALMKLSNPEVSVKIIHKAVGGVSESDVLFASASEAVIIGFHVRPTIQARESAKREEVDIRLYNIIYAAVEDVKAALEGMLEPEISEELTATIEVRETFRVPKAGVIAGSYVLSGKASRNDLTKVFRDDKLLHESRISSLKRFKEDVKEVSSGFECGVGLEDFDDIKVGDIIETYRQVKTARKL